jgi:hypothetical protein
MRECNRCGGNGPFCHRRNHCKECQAKASRMSYYRNRFVYIERAARKRAIEYGCEVEVLDYAAIYDSYIDTPCHICSCNMSILDHLEFDHIIALAHRGPHIASNVRLLHRHCNRGLSFEDFLRLRRLRALRELGKRV